MNKMNTEVYYAINIVNTYLHSKRFFIVHRFCLLVQDDGKSEYIYYFHLLGCNNKKKFLKLKWILNDSTYQYYHTSYTELSFDDIINLAGELSYHSKYKRDIKGKIWIIDR